MISSNIIRQDNGLLKRIKDVARDYSTKVAVGYFGNQKHGKRPITVRQIATYHEFGTKRMPKRPFIAPALKKNRMNYLKLAGKQITPVIRNRQTTTNVWKMLGEQAVSDVRDYIVAGSFAPLAPITAKRKGHSIPLLDTHQMYSSVTYRVK